MIENNVAYTKKPLYLHKKKRKEPRFRRRGLLMVYEGASFWRKVILSLTQKELHGAGVLAVGKGCGLQKKTTKQKCGGKELNRNVRRAPCCFPFSQGSVGADILVSEKKGRKEERTQEKGSCRHSPQNFIFLRKVLQKQREWGEDWSNHLFSRSGRGYGSNQ